MDATLESLQSAQEPLERREQQPGAVMPGTTDEQSGADANEGGADRDTKSNLPEICPTSFVFKEMLSDSDPPVPSYDQLEKFGLFDVTICSESLARYRSKYPLPQPQELTGDEEENQPPSPARPLPQHRHSIAISSLAPPSSYSPPLASPTLVAASNRLSPFALARRASRKSRPSQSRTKSTNDVLPKEAAVPPGLSPELKSMPLPGPERRPSIDCTACTAYTVTTQSVLAPEASLYRDSTIKEKRGAMSRKLRKNPNNRPPLPTIRTDDDFLLRPSSQFRSRSPSPARSTNRSRSSTSPVTHRKQGWRSSLSNLVSPITSPTSFQMPHELAIASPQPRSPSPIDSFPSAIRREPALPPVDKSFVDHTLGNRRRNDSFSDSYFGDSENHRLSVHHQHSSSSSGTPPTHSTRRDRTRTQSTQIPSPSSPVSTGNLWARALKFGGRKGTGSRASSVASSSTSTTSWDLVDGEASYSVERGTFEVLRTKRAPQVGELSRPTAKRTTSEGGGAGREYEQTGTRNQAQGQILEASTSSPNLSKITEYPESLDSRLLSHRSGTHPYWYLSNESPSASMDSFHAGSSLGGFHTPPVTANSSNTILALEHTPSTHFTARRIRSRSALTSTVEPPEAVQEDDLPSSRARPTISSATPSSSSPSSLRSRPQSIASTTYRSTHSSSQDSFFSRRGEDGRLGGGGDYADPENDDLEGVEDGGEDTGATSVTEGEEDEVEAREVLKRHLIIDSQHVVAAQRDTSSAPKTPIAI